MTAIGSTDTERANRLHADPLPFCEGIDLLRALDADDDGPSFAGSAPWVEAAAEAIGAERIRCVALRDDDGRAVGALALELGRTTWRSGPIRHEVLRWPMADLGWRYAPRWTANAAPLHRMRWWRAVQSAFPDARLELSRTATDASAPHPLVPPRSRVRGGGAVWALDVDGDVSAWHAVLLGRHRRDLGKYRRALERSGARFRDLTLGDDADEWCATLFDLHARRIASKQQRSAALHPENRGFVETLVRRETGRRLRFTRVDLDGHTIGAVAAFVDRGRYEAYVSGFDPDVHRFDLGRQLPVAQVLAEFGRSLRRIDLRGGDLAYKRELGMQPVPTIDLVTRPTPFAALQEDVVATAFHWYRGVRAFLGKGDRSGR